MRPLRRTSCHSLMVAVLLAALTQLAQAQDTAIGLQVKFRDGILADASAPLLEAVHRQLAGAIPVGFRQGPASRDGAVRLVLNAPLSIDQARAALNVIRLDPAVLYANIAPSEQPGPSIQPPADSRPISRLIVKYRDKATSELAKANTSLPAVRLSRIEALAGTAVAHERGTSRGEYIVRFIAPMLPARAAEAARLLAQDADVEYADPDYWVQATLTPNDPYYLDTSVYGQWHLKSPSAEPGGANLPSAWDYTTGASPIVVAVIDTGVLPNHPDLAGRFVAGFDMILDPSIAVDGGGRDSDPTDPGTWANANECGAGSPAKQSTWHGTHVAGTIGAVTNNGTGVAGINWVGKLLPVRVLGKCGSGQWSDINDAIVWAAGGAISGTPANTNAARVLNLSIGGGNGCLSSTQAAINVALGANAVIVVSAGNANDSAWLNNPGACSGVVTVAATQRQGYKAEYSSYGAAVEISAPGGGDNFPSGVQYNVIWSTYNSGTTSAIEGTGYISGPDVGTSMAAPHVAGIASLMLSVNPALTPAQVLAKLQSTARTFPGGGPTCDTGTVRPPQASWYSCQCTTSLCGAGIVDARAAVIAALPTSSGTATVSNNAYGTLTVSGATLSGNTISNLQANATIQLGSIAGAANSYIHLNFQGFNIAPGASLTIRSGAPNQSVYLYSANGSATSISGALRMQGGNGASPPFLYLENENGITVYPGGSVIAPNGMTVNTLAHSGSWTQGQPLVNKGTLDGGYLLYLRSARVTGGGAFKGDEVDISTYGNANNPVNGAHYLANGIQLFPSTGTDIALLLNAYGSSPQVLNIMLNGNAVAWMPSAWPAGWPFPMNNAVVPPGGSRPAGAPEPSYGGGSMIVQATGSLKLHQGPTNNFVFPGAIAFKAGGTLDLNGVVVNQGWTTTGKQFQGVFFESPNIISPAGNIQVLTNNPNWINFSTFPQQHVRTWSLTPSSGGGASFVVADGFATHLNTYSATIEAAANGQCWVCLINSAWVDMY